MMKWAGEYNLTFAKKGGGKRGKRRKKGKKKERKQKKEKGRKRKLKKNIMEERNQVKI